MKKYRKLTPPNVAILIPKPFSKFQKVKKQTQKDPFEIQKSKIILKSKKVQKTDPTKCGHSDSSDQTHPEVRFLALRIFFMNWGVLLKEIKFPKFGPASAKNRKWEEPFSHCWPAGSLVTVFDKVCLSVCVCVC